MQTYTTTPMVGQWVSQALQTYELSQTAAPVWSSLILYGFKWQEVVLSPIAPAPNVMDERMLMQLYAEFAEEDRELANAGLADYAHSLAVEDGLA